MEMEMEEMMMMDSTAAESKTAKQQTRDQNVQPWRGDRPTDRPTDRWNNY